jgi:hypothetical protein
MRVQMHVQEGAFVRVLQDAMMHVSACTMRERKTVCTVLRKPISITPCLPLSLLCNAANKYLAVEHA